MAFELQDALQATAIGRIDHFLDDLDGTTPGRGILYNLEIKDQFGEVMKVRSGDEQPHLTAQQITNLLNFMTARRAALPGNLGLPAGHSLGRLVWRVRDLDGTAGNRSIHCRAIELDAGGQFVQRLTFNDQPNLSGPQLTAILQFLTDQRNVAISQILA